MALPGPCATARDVEHAAVLRGTTCAAHRRRLAPRCSWRQTSSAAPRAPPAQRRSPAPPLRAVALSAQSGTALRKPSGAAASVWRGIDASFWAVVDPLAEEARCADGDEDDGLGGPCNEAVAQALWLRRLAEEQRELLAGRLRPMPEPLAVRGPGFGAEPLADQASARDAARALQADGVVFLRGVVPAPLCDALKAQVDARAEAAREQLGGSLRRVDALLEWDGAGRAAALAAAGPGGVASILALLPDATADAQLVEFSVLSTEPGADRQVLHPDVRADAQHAPLFSLFVALQDVAPEMGPTCFVLRTHDAASHAAFPAGPVTDSARRLLRGAHALDAPMRKGDAALYDARLLHAGGRNDPEAGARRGLLTLTFMRGPVPAAPERRNSGGSAFSARPEVLQQRLTVGRMAQLAAQEALCSAGPNAHVSI